MHDQTSVAGVPDEVSRPLAEFVGRAWVTAAVAAWLAGQARRFVLVGDPGSGKSTVAARMIQQGIAGRGGTVHPKAWHFCRAGDRATLLPENVIKGIAEQLAKNLDGFLDVLTAGDEEQDRSANAISVTVTVSGNVLTGASVTGVGKINIEIRETDPERIAERSLRRPLLQLEKQGRLPADIVIVIDGLDECLALPSGEDTVDLLDSISRSAAHMPAQVRFLFTTRGDRRILRKVGPASLDLISDAPRGEDDVFLYALHRLTRVLSEDQATVLARRIAQTGAGNFLYARYVLDDLVADPADLAAADPDTTHLPPGLEAVYEEFLERELVRRTEPWSTRYRPLLGLLAIAQGEGLLREDLIGASGLRGSQVDDATEALAQYLAGPSPDGPFRLYHQSFRDYLLSERGYTVYPEEAHEQLIRHLINAAPSAGAAKDWSAVGAYTARYLALHAAQCGLLQEVIREGFLAYAEPHVMRSALHTDGAWPELPGTYDLAFPDLLGQPPGQRALALLTAAARSDQSMLTKLRAVLPTPVADIAWSVLTAEILPTRRRPWSAISMLSLGNVRGDLVAVFADVEERDNLRLWYPERDEIRTIPTLVKARIPTGSQLFVVEVGNKVIVGWHGSPEAGGACAIDADTGEMLHAAWSPGRTALLWHGQDMQVIETSPVTGEVWIRPAGGLPLWQSERDGNTIVLKRTETLDRLTPVVTLSSQVTHLYPFSATSPPQAVAICTDANEAYILDLSEGTSTLTGPISADKWVERGFASVSYRGETLLAIASTQAAVLIVDPRDGTVRDSISARQVSQAAPHEVIVDALHFVVTDDGPHLLLRTRDRALLPWSMSRKEFMPAVHLPGLKCVATTEHGEMPLLGAGMLDGVWLYDYRKVTTGTRSADPHGPVHIITAGAVGSHSLVAWLAVGTDATVLWVADPGNGHVLERHVLSGLHPELLALGQAGNRLAIIAVTDLFHSIAWLCWLGENAPPVQFPLCQAVVRHPPLSNH